MQIQKHIVTLEWFTALVALLLPMTVCEANEPLTPAKRPLKVFILTGQSNMQGHAQVRTIDAIQLNPQAAPLLKLMKNEDGTLRTCERTWISSIGSAQEEQTGRLTAGFGAAANGPKIGPEFTFGLEMEATHEDPILIIKTAWGGKSLNTDFRPPSAGPYEFNAQQLENFKKQNKDIDKILADKTDATGRYYHLMIDHVKSVLADISRVYPEYDKAQGYELAGIVWFQGWNDMVDGGSYPNRNQSGGYDQYSTLLTHFIRDVRKDLDSPNLPFVIGVMGVGGPTNLYGPDQQRYLTVHQGFRDAMAAPASMPEFKGNVAVVLTENYWDTEFVTLRNQERSFKPQVDKIKAEMKEGSLSRDQGMAAIDKIYNANFDQRQMRILKESVSNQDYHYLGSAGIIGQIGQGFSQAMNTMIE
ncbi:hypothetical protein FF011L_32470 [Roseimaritima multifibrata]|uniref:Sialate O-acetylesterase domain-containing protein n=1 Tax=Roseimaritima multifibrata TaxID=1930274 RepID=A0A517MHW8_9BACT|nr:sialate O-acetylesterase [Roseimaritima multifibrata]QDS94468.1 hypothetical protein FF011L_32470 [Roseimaritima multifibrata]